ncbi:MAG: DUF3194 domain-containing protein [Candidatus Nezhaarchaeota archaeon]|nr:DUF3194 domain-containing protein [Candidatus Nezhaarchaeota archaeon]MCX8141936.1 DUF3194 domain-containing protein [Candidatus Nezhaarchaeota archaeon]MDW8050283.1 DUF3194 domain-containing protein [Nitrososphaerota archaeon]
MERDSLETILKMVQEKALSYAMKIVSPKELVDINIMLFFSEGNLTVDVQLSLHEASMKDPNEVARKIAQYVIDVFDRLWRESCEVNERGETH